MSINAILYTRYNLTACINPVFVTDGPPVMLSPSSVITVSPTVTLPFLPVSYVLKAEPAVFRPEHWS